MDVETAFKKISEIQDIPLGKLFNDSQRTEFARGHINKGYAGQILELVIGLELSGKLNDLEDGELKTTILKNNMTREWIPITVLNHLLDEMMNSLAWEETKVFKKIHNFILVPCHKDSKDWREWRFAAPIHVSNTLNPELFSKFKADYEHIASRIRETIVGQKLLHTINGPNYLLQIRTKDNPPYRPFVYKNHIIGNKKYAIGLTSRFVRDLVNEHRGTKNKHKNQRDTSKYN